jgi:hypothetical protein
MQTLGNSHVNETDEKKYYVHGLSMSCISMQN